MPGRPCPGGKRASVSLPGVRSHRGVAVLLLLFCSLNLSIAGV